MDKGRRTGMYVVIVLIVLALIALMVVKQVAKHQLVTGLGNRDLSVRVPAAEKLLAMEKLADSLAGMPVYKRSYTAQALGEIHTDESTAILGTILRDEEDAPSRWAGLALAKHGKRAIPTLTAALSAGGATKDNAVQALKTLGVEAGPRLRFLLADRGPYAAAAQALAKIGGVGADALMRGAYSMDNKLRVQSIAKLAAEKRPGALRANLDNLTTDKLSQVDDAIPALGVLGDPAAGPALVPFLKTGKRTATAVSIGMMRYAGAVEPLLAQIPAGDPAYRNAAVLALSRIGAPAVPALIRELHSPKVVMRQSAAKALIGAKSAQATAALMAAVSDPDAGVRAPAARALGWEGNLTAVEVLVRALRDSDWRVVDAAAGALGDIGTTAIERLLAVVAAPGQDVRVSFQISRALAIMGYQATPKLVRALSSPNPEVQKWSATALGSIGDQRAVPELQQLSKRATGNVQWVAEEQLRVLTGRTGF